MLLPTHPDMHSLLKTYFRNDVILLAGDISDDLNTVSWVFQQLSGAYDTVVYVPGNHGRAKEIELLLKLVLFIQGSCA